MRLVWIPLMMSRCFSPTTISVMSDACLLAKRWTERAAQEFTSTSNMSAIRELTSGLIRTIW